MADSGAGIGRAVVESGGILRWWRGGFRQTKSPDPSCHGLIALIPWLLGSRAESGRQQVWADGMELRNLPGVCNTAGRIIEAPQKETTEMLARKVLVMSLVLVGLGAATQAQREGKSRPPAPPVTDTVKVTGPVKGAPTGLTFVIATRKGTTTVDASKATIRFKGRFANVATIKSGSFVQAAGKMEGSTLKASEVKILRVPGLPGSGAKKKP